MNKNHEQHNTMGIQDFFTWKSQTTSNLAPADDEEGPADVDEPPDHQTPRKIEPQKDFHKSLVRPQSLRKESLLTMAFQKPTECEVTKPEIKVATDLTRRRSMMSNASLASTAELTSDGGFTSPARVDTPSPPFPNTTYTSFSPYSITAKTKRSSPPILAPPMPYKESTPAEVVSVSPKAQNLVAPVPRKRCISFMCDGKKGMTANNMSPASSAAPSITESSPKATKPEPPKLRKSMIQFACPGPRQVEKAATKVETATTVKTTEPPKRTPARSPSIPRKSPRPVAQTRSSSSIRRSSQSPSAVRAKPKYIVVDEKSINSSEATRFHEFASAEPQEDDWISKDVDVLQEKLTINDTLRKENAIRRLGNEAEQEALEEDEDDENDSDDDNDDEDDDDLDDEFLDDGSDDEASDGNETDNEAGFAESDDESDGEEFAFWTPGKRPTRDEISTFRPSAHRTASTSSIDSLNHMSPKNGRKPKRRPIKIRPGTPDLPDSTDFVCGTLDEDRPLEDAYVSCMEARKHARHKQTPQDIDPSFPTSDPEDEEDEIDEIEVANDSDEHLWIHGKFEESDEERHGRRRSTIRKSPNLSPRRLHSPPPPKRLHSPPPPKHRLRSPPPRKLFGNSPRHRSPPPAGMNMRSPPGSPAETTVRAIAFAPLGSRPGLTHTKSLPRTPNAFCRQYAKSRLAAANGNDGIENQDGHTRGAIDIVKGLEQKRQRRKENFYKKNRGHVQRRPLPGKGAERMRELGLLMAGKTGAQDPYMLSA